ncbi:hypothetical protein D1627_10655 [Pontibacter oryzae]|uniref:Uncharacterized protein n=1 Tax=Pontibacter oryzae TaxID=2304593 RepID=A0A399S591_9BACT|nr:hypothetical protein D1627_10655 [Pontibacter oryzae]
MSLHNTYYKVALIGLGLSMILQLLLFLMVGAYLAAVISPLYPVWIIFFIVGWRKAHPRR